MLLLPDAQHSIPSSTKLKWMCFAACSLSLSNQQQDDETSWKFFFDKDRWKAKRGAITRDQQEKDECCLKEFDGVTSFRVSRTVLEVNDSRAKPWIEQFTHSLWIWNVSAINVTCGNREKCKTKSRTWSYRCSIWF